MAYKSIPWEQEQPFLPPPDPHEWLPEDHLAQAVLDAVACFDLTPLTRGLAEPRGRASYHPAMMSRCCCTPTAWACSPAARSSDAATPISRSG